MKLDGLLGAVVIGALVTTPAVARAGDDEPTTVRDAYLGLRDAGCDVATIGSPIVARALRNVPYAQHGKIFKSAELAYLFAQDGGWYTPSDAAADVGADDRACVRKLDAQEQKLRKRVKLKKAIEQAITRHPGAILDMTRLVAPDWKKFWQTEKTRDGVRHWTVGFEAGDGAALVTIECTLPEAEAKAKAPAWSKLECHAIAAG